MLADWKLGLVQRHFQGARGGVGEETREEECHMKDCMEDKAKEETAQKHKEEAAEMVVENLSDQLRKLREKVAKSKTENGELDRQRNQEKEARVMAEDKAREWKELAIKADMRIEELEGKVMRGEAAEKQLEETVARMDQERENEESFKKDKEVEVVEKEMEMYRLFKKSKELVLELEVLRRLQVKNEEEIKKLKLEKGQLEESGVKAYRKETMKRGTQYFLDKVEKQRSEMLEFLGEMGQEQRRNIEAMVARGAVGQVTRMNEFSARLVQMKEDVEAQCEEVVARTRGGQGVHHFHLSLSLPAVLNGGGEEEAMCIICMEGMVECPNTWNPHHQCNSYCLLVWGVSALECGHAFHGGCVHTWLERRLHQRVRGDPGVEVQCPTCRQQVHQGAVRRMSDKMANLLNGQGHEMHGPRPPRRGPWLRLWQRGEVEVRGRRAGAVV